MADPIVSENDIADVSLLDTPIAPADAPSEPADTSQNNGADTPDKPAADDSSANATEATDQDADSPTGDEPGQDQNPAQDQPTDEQQREQQQARAQQEWQQRQRTKNRVENQIDQAYGPKTEDELIEEGVPASDAKVEALRQEMLFSQQRAHIAELNASMQVEAVNVFNDFPVFNPKSPDYDPEFANMVESQYKTSARVQTDDNGIVLNAEVPLYDFYQQMATIYSRGSTKGAQKGQTAMQQMIARTENPGGSSSANGNQSNDLAAMEERLGDVVIT